MQILVPSTLAERLNFTRAVREELARPPDRLPSRVAEHAVGRRYKRTGDRIQALAEGGFRTDEELVIWMPKARFQYRPLSAVAFDARVLFRAIVRDLTGALLEEDRLKDTSATFEQDVLEDEGAKYVLISDIASFYQYVDHEYLEQRLIESTGRADSPSAVRDFLDGLMRSGIGLPQNLGPSDDLAELITAPLQRRLERVGFHTARHNDDFRVGARTFQAARRALELLHEETRQVGLSLNDAKTRILRRETYEANLGEVETYGEETIDAEGDIPVDVETTVAALAISLQRRQRDEGSRMDELRDARVVSGALADLTRAQDTSGITYGRQITALYPQLTQMYGRYLRSLVTGNAGQEVISHVEEEFQVRLTDWQTLWMLEPVLAFADPLPESLADWLTQIMNDRLRSPLLRARAVLGLAYDGRLEPQEVTPMIDPAPEVARPDLAAAYGAAVAFREGDVDADLFETDMLRASANVGTVGPAAWS